MKPSSFERPPNNPYSLDAEPTEEPLDTPKKKDDKKEKDSKDKPDKKHVDEEERKKEKKQEDEKNKKAAQKPEKVTTEDEEALEEKKQKRQSLVERSFRYKKRYEEMPIPHNPWVIARLMVAEHILAIHEQIEQPPVDASPLDELRLLATLDYMGSIADALESPEADSPSEIKETCETLIQLAEETLQEGDENIADVLIDTNTDSAQMSNEDILKAPEQNLSANNALPVSGAALIAVLIHARQQTHQATVLSGPTPYVTPSSPHSSGGRVDSNSTAGGPTTMHPVPRDERPAAASPPHVSRRDSPLVAPERHSSPSETPLDPIIPRSRAETHPTSSRRSTEPLAAFAVATTLVAPRVDRHPVVKNEYTPHSTPRAHSNLYESPATSHTPTRSVHSPETSHANTNHQTHNSFAPTSQAAHSIPHPETSSQAHSPDLQHTNESVSHASHKIEHLPLASLLAMAETVSIGHGQRLRNAYEKGAIDKDGLVKILKSHSKHHDFIQEYKQQVVKRRNLIQSSPEFLSSSVPKNDASTRTADNTVSESPVTPYDFQPDKNTGDFAPTSDLPQTQKQPASIDPFDTPDEKIAHPAWLVPVLLGILIIVVGTLLAFLILQ